MKISGKQLGIIECDLNIKPLQQAAESLRRCIGYSFKSAKPALLPPSRRSQDLQPNSIAIGTAADHPVLKEWVSQGRLNSFQHESASDAYEIRLIDESVVVIGANPRGALYGAYRLERILQSEGGVPSNIHEKGQPTLDLRLLHPRVRGDFKDYRREDFEFIARTGGNTVLLQHDWMAEKTLFSFVRSPEFPDVISHDDLELNRAKLRLYLDWCNQFGLGAAFWLCEMVCQGGPWMPNDYREAFLKKFPAEVLSDSGTYQGQVLCLAHPLVKQAYRGMIRQMLHDFPELGMFLVFTKDSNAELCSPDHCERHRGVDKFSQYYELLAFLQNEINRIRPDVHVFSLSWSWAFRSNPKFLAQQASLPPGAGMATLPDGEAWSFDRKLTDALREERDVTRRHNQKLIGYDIFLWGDDTIFPSTELYDFPLGIAAKLRRWQALGADGVFDQWGTQCEYDSANAVALSELFFNPELAAPERVSAWVGKLAEHLYGKEAGPVVASAWNEIELAQQIQSDHCYYWHPLRPNWATIPLGTPLTIEALQKTILPDPEPSKPDGKNNYGPPSDGVETARVLGAALMKAAEHFHRAIAYLHEAIKTLPENWMSPSGAWLEEAAEGRTRLRPIEQLKKQLVSVRLQEGVQREFAHFFSAYAIAKSLSTDDAVTRTQKLDQLFHIQSQAAISSPPVAELLEKTGTTGKISRQFRERVSGLPESRCAPVA